MVGEEKMEDEEGEEGIIYNKYKKEQKKERRKERNKEREVSAERDRGYPDLVKKANNDAKRCARRCSVLSVRLAADASTMFSFISHLIGHLSHSLSAALCKLQVVRDQAKGNSHIQPMSHDTRITIYLFFF
jgi:hypothetical protein